MVEIAVRAAVWLLRRLCAADHRRFMAGLDDIEGVQARLRRRLMSDLARTDYGRTFPDPPLAGYADLQPWLARQIGGEKAVIARRAFVHVETTSGSAGAIKAIPYTRAAMAGFARMFRIWACDLLVGGLRPRSGKIFISQSPRGSVRRETQYLGGVLDRLLSPFLVRLKGGDDFLDDVATTLLAERDLEIISVWSPSYLTVVLDHIDRRGLGDWRHAWPRLQLISCWDEGQAAAIAAELRARFPGVRVQGKGLLATEAAMTVPIEGVGALPLYQDIYFEFLADGAVHLLHQLSAGETYEVVITNPAGLVRYRTGDQVRVTGHHGVAPILSFVGRTGQVSDLVGEKLSEAFVGEALTPLVPSGRFVVVPATGHYMLLSETAVDAASADTALAAAHHYRLARAQGQLGPVEVRIIPSLLEKQKQFHTASGQAIGHIKDSALISDPLRAAAFLAFIG